MVIANIRQTICFKITEVFNAILGKIVKMSSMLLFCGLFLFSSYCRAGSAVQKFTPGM